MKIEKKKIKDLIPAFYNPRRSTPDQEKNLAESLRKFGVVEPIVWNKQTKNVVGGHFRLRELEKLGFKEVDCVIVDLSLDDEKELNIRLNANTGDWDLNSLGEHFDLDLIQDWGFDMPEEFKEEESLEAVEDDFESEPIEQIKTDIKHGDIIQIGPHRLMCGDSTELADVERLMDGDISELLFTSPPYSGMRDYEGNKDLSVDNLIEFIPTYKEFAKYQVINLGIQRKDNEVILYWDDYIKQAKECGYKFLSWNVWDKTQGGSIASATAMFLLTHEWLFVFGREFKKLNRTIPNQIDKYEARHGKNWQKGLENKKIRLKDGSIGETKSKTYSHHQIHSVIQYVPELGKIREHHPAMYPVLLPSSYIEAMTEKNEIIIDPFLGSGTTMVACHQLKRVCYGMELEPKYCQVIIDRMKKLDPDIKIAKV